MIMEINLDISTIMEIYDTNLTQKSNLKRDRKGL